MLTDKLKYKTFDSLLSEVQYEFRKYYLEGQINPQDFIKVAKKCNYELGLKIFSTKNEVLEIENGRCRLPLNFNVMNFAFLLGKRKVTYPVVHGTHTETQILGNNVTCGENVVDANTCVVNLGTSLNCKGETVLLTQILKYETRTWDEFYKVRFKDSSEHIDISCPNKQWHSNNTAYISDGFIYTSFKTGELHINYQALLEDEEGNLLVPDHDLLNEFYEYAIKRRVLENLIMNGENISQAQIQIIEQRHREARNNAMSLVNTPDFGELRAIWETNRKAQYSNYYHMFQS